MRLPLVLCALMLTGCAEPAPSAEPGPRTPAPVPPSLLVDRTGGGSLQVYVHAKHGNVRYDFINLTRHNDFQPNASWTEETRSRASAYALDLDLEVARANLTLATVEGAQRFAWSGRLALNDTARPARLQVEVFDPEEGFEAPRNVTLPWETLLGPAPEGAP